MGEAFRSCPRITQMDVGNCILERGLSKIQPPFSGGIEMAERSTTSRRPKRPKGNRIVVLLIVGIIQCAAVLMVGDCVRGEEQEKWWLEFEERSHEDGYRLSISQDGQIQIEYGRKETWNKVLKQALAGDDLIETHALFTSIVGNFDIDATRNVPRSECPLFYHFAIRTALSNNR